MMSWIEAEKEEARLKRYDSGIKKLVELVAFFSYHNPDNYNPTDGMAVRLLYDLGLLDTDNVDKERVKVNKIIDDYYSSGEINQENRVSNV